MESLALTATGSLLLNGCNAVAAVQHPPPTQDLCWSEDFEPPRELYNINSGADYEWEFACSEVNELLGHVRKLVAGRVHGCMRLEVGV
jgi:hypothetical protein